MFWFAAENQVAEAEAAQLSNTQLKPPQKHDPAWYKREQQRANPQTSRGEPLWRTHVQPRRGFQGEEWAVEKRSSSRDRLSCRVGVGGKLGWPIVDVRLG